MSYRVIRAWFKGLLLRYRIKRGKQVWGRQPETGVTMKGKATISAVVTRADGSVQDLGVLYEGRV